MKTVINFNYPWFPKSKDLDDLNQILGNEVSYAKAWNTEVWDKVWLTIDREITSEINLRMNVGLANKSTVGEALNENA